MKYIIDIEDSPVNGLYKAKNFKTLVFDELGLGKLVKYDSEMIENAIEDAYGDGMNDAWDAARKIACSVEDGGFSCGELQRIFGCGFAPDIMRDLSADEAKKRIADFKEIKDKICIGDEVTAEDGASRFIVTHIANDISGIDLNGNTYAYMPEEIDGKTGMHYDILETLRGTPFMMTCRGCSYD